MQAATMTYSNDTTPSLSVAQTVQKVAGLNVKLQHKPNSLSKMKGCGRRNQPLVIEHAAAGEFLLTCAKFLLFRAIFLLGNQTQFSNGKQGKHLFTKMSTFSQPF